MARDDYVDPASLSFDFTAALSLAKRCKVVANYRLDEGVGGALHSKQHKNSI